MIGNIPYPTTHTYKANIWGYPLPGGFDNTSEGEHDVKEHIQIARVKLEETPTYDRIDGLIKT